MPFLAWDPVTLGADGEPLAPGNEVTSYPVYRCPSPGGACDKTNATKIGTVAAPSTSFDLAGQPTPARFFVTAVNLGGESVDSVLVKLTPSTSPKPKLAVIVEIPS